MLLGICDYAKWIEAISGVVIAALAVLGWVGRWIYSLWTAPDLCVANDKKAFFCNPRIDLKKDSSSKEELSAEFFVPIENIGRSTAIHTTVSVDCVLKKKGDWNSLENIYYGMPLRLRWRTGKTDEAIPGKDCSYFKLISFQENIKGEDSPGAKREKALLCMLCVDAESRSSAGSMVQLSNGNAITAFVHIKFRAQNVAQTSEKWLYVNWDGAYGKVNSGNFSIRVASEEEAAKVKVKYDEIRKTEG